MSCTAPATQKAPLQIHFKRPMPTIVFEAGAKTSRVATFLQSAESIAPANKNDAWTSICEHVVLLPFWLPYVLHATAACTFWTAQLPNVLRAWGVLNIWTSKSASRHSCVHKTSTSKSAPNVVCFVFCAFWLQTVLCATAACAFGRSNLLKVLQGWGAFYNILTRLTLKWASHHSRMHFFHIATSKRAPTLRCFGHFHVEISFGPQRRAIFSLILPDDIASAALASLYFWTLRRPNALEKHSVSRLFYHVHPFSIFSIFSIMFTPFSHTEIFFLLLFSSLALPPPLLHHLSISRKFDF